MSIKNTLQFNGFLYHHSIDEDPNTGDFNFHCHDMCEIYFFLNGDGEFVVEGNRYELRKNTVIILRPNEFHYFKLNSPETYERCALHFNPNEFKHTLFSDLLLNPFLNRTLGEKNQFIPLPDDNFVELFQRIDFCAELPEDESRIKIQFLLGELLSMILNMSRRTEFTSSHDTNNSFAASVLHYINLNISKKISLDQLATTFFVSKFYLSHVFKKYTGVSVLEYMLRKKVLLASQLIKNGRKATEASEQFGFGDYSTFYRAYKRILGESPSKKIVKK